MVPHKHSGSCLRRCHWLTNRSMQVIPHLPKVKQVRLASTIMNGLQRAGMSAIAVINHPPVPISRSGGGIGQLYRGMSGRVAGVGGGCRQGIQPASRSMNAHPASQPTDAPPQRQQCLPQQQSLPARGTPINH